MAKNKPIKPESKELTLANQVKEALSSGPLFQSLPEQVELPVGIISWSILDQLEKVIKGRKEQYRQYFLELAKEEGSPLLDKETGRPKGGESLSIDGSKITRECRPESMPSDDSLRELLLEKNIPFDEVFDEVKTVSVNRSKLNYLIDSGKLSQKEIDSHKKVTYALKVNKSKVLSAALKEMTDKLNGTQEVLILDDSKESEYDPLPTADETKYQG